MSRPVRLFVLLGLLCALAAWGRPGRAGALEQRLKKDKTAAAIHALLVLGYSDLRADLAGTTAGACGSLVKARGIFESSLREYYLRTSDTGFDDQLKRWFI